MSNQRWFNVNGLGGYRFHLGHMDNELAVSGTRRAMSSRSLRYLHIGRRIQAHAAAQPDRRIFTFLADGDGDERHLSCRELDRRARAIAAHLQERNLAGERALLLFPPG